MSQNILSPTNGTTSRSKIITRHAHLAEYAEIGRIAAKTYLNTSLTQFLAPRCHEYYSDYEAGFIQRALSRMLDPRNVTIVVCEESNPGFAIGYTQLVRLGDDEGAKKQRKSRSGLWLWSLGLVSRGWYALKGLVAPDRSENPEATKEFMRWGDEEDKLHWSPYPERKNRWHVQSCVVREEFQGRGAGKLLMGEVIRRAEEEGVVVGLEASEEGERLYRRVGFELLGRFRSSPRQGEDEHGGVMLYTPQGLKKRI